MQADVFLFISLSVNSRFSMKIAIDGVSDISSNYNVRCTSIIAIIKNEP